MRTSGRALDPIALVPLLVAVVSLILLTGGPGEFLQAVERLLRNVVVTATDWAQEL